MIRVTLMHKPARGVVVELGSGRVWARAMRRLYGFSFEVFNGIDPVFEAKLKRRHLSVSAGSFGFSAGVYS